MLGALQMPAQAIGDPAGQQESLNRMVSFHVDVQLHHMAEGVSAVRWIKHHGQGLMPASESQPIEVVDGLAAFDPRREEIQAEPRVTQG